MTLRGGRYEIIRVIASGGMARVYLGRALGAGGFERLVAVKAMHPHLASEPEFVDMFLDEARLAARIRHPNVVGTLDVQQDEAGIFLVMEYVEGPSLMAVLRELRRKGQPAPIDVVLRVFHDTLAGLHAAHELTSATGEPLNLVHRDVSPANILVGVDGVTRITDFGVARAESRLSSTKGGEVKGKIPYMAPEQIQREDINRRTDVYAAGAVLWEVLSGERLIRGENDGERLMAILNAERRPLRALNAAVPEAIEAVCLTALQPAPKDRYATAAALAEALESAAAAAGLVIAAPRAVAAFVRELNVHESPNDLPSSSSRPFEASGPRSGVNVTAGAISAASELDPPVSTHAGAVATAAEPPRARRRSPLLLGAFGALVIAAVVGGVLWSRRARPVTERALSETISPTATATATAMATATATAAAPPMTTATAATTTATATAAPASGGAPRGAAGKAAPKASATGHPAPSPTNFRPKEL